MPGTLQNKINYSYLMEFLTALFVSQLERYNFDIIIWEKKVENLKKPNRISKEMTVIMKRHKNIFTFFSLHGCILYTYINGQFYE